MSPLLLSLLISPIIQQLQAATSPIRVLGYADDVMLIFSHRPHRAIEQIHLCLPDLLWFAHYAGLNVNFVTLTERLALLELWILAVLSLSARVVFPDEAVIASLQSVYHTALRTTH